MTGFNNIQPKIKMLKFEHRGKLSLYLEDGRVIIVPLSNFPPIRKLNYLQRKKWQILDGIGFTFQDTDELFHLSQILGSVDPPCC